MEHNGDCGSEESRKTSRSLHCSQERYKRGALPPTLKKHVSLTPIAVVRRTRTVTQNEGKLTQDTRQRVHRLPLIFSDLLLRRTLRGRHNGAQALQVRNHPLGVRLRHLSNSLHHLVDAIRA